MRTILQIYDEIVQEKQNQALLSDLSPNPETSLSLLADLTSSSKVAIWRLWAYIIAVAIWTHEQLWEVFKSEVAAIAAAAPAGTMRWYAAQMLAFQYGYDLEYVNNKYQYSDIDTEAQIVKRCAVQERSDGVVLIKVAAHDNDGQPIVLTAPELSALDSYAGKIKFAGTKLAVVSLSADTVAIEYDIYYDPIIPLTTIQADLQIVIDAFLVNLPFNAQFNITSFTDVIQGVQGIVDPIFVSASATPSGGSPQSFTQNYIPASGYFQFDDTAVNMFNFIPQVPQ